MGWPLSTLIFPSTPLPPMSLPDACSCHTSLDQPPATKLGNQAWVCRMPNSNAIRAQATRQVWAVCLARRNWIGTWSRLSWQGAATELAITERGHGACRHGSLDPGRGDVRERHCEGNQRPAGAGRRAGTRLGAGGGSSESTGPQAENTTGGDGNEWSTFFCAWRASSSEVRANGSLRCDAATARAANPTAHHFGLKLNRARARAPQWPALWLSWHLGV